VEKQVEVLDREVDGVKDEENDEESMGGSILTNFEVRISTATK
jgi:hypothetical protein